MKKKEYKAKKVPLSEVLRTIYGIVKADTFPKREFVKMIIKSAIRGAASGGATWFSGQWINIAQSDLTQHHGLRNPLVYVFGGLEQLTYFMSSMMQLSIERDRRSFQLKVTSKLSEFAEKIYLDMDPEYRLYKTSSDFKQAANTASNAINNFTNNLVELVRASSNIAATGAVLFGINKALLAGLTAWGCINTCWTLKYFNAMDPKWEKLRDQEKLSNERTGNISSNAGLIQRTSNKNRYTRIIGLEKEKVRSKKSFLDKVVMNFWTGNEIVDSTVYISTIAMAFMAAQTGNLEIGTLRAYMGSSGSFLGSASSMAFILSRIQTSIAEYNEAMETLRTLPKIVNKKDAITFDIKKFEKNPPSIEFHRVTHCYKDKDGQKQKPVLTDFSLKINSGERVALLGESGSGKTTILSLLLREFEQDSGDIWVDGHRNDTIVLDSLRDIVRYIPQGDGYLNRSVRENLLLVKDDASDADIKSALKSAKILDVIEKKGGLDVPMGNGGNALSGGERHRIGIARAFLGVAPVMIFDEPTGNLDVDTSKNIISTIRKITRGKTAIVVTHSPIDALEFDRVIVMKNGKIVDDGKPSDLLAKNGPFSKMMKIQIGKVEKHMSAIEQAKNKVLIKKAKKSLSPIKEQKER